MSHITDPPVYNAVSTYENEYNETPPSYFDIVGQLEVAKYNAKSQADLALKTFTILTRSCIFDEIIAFF